jgi:HlyD family secretion protein
MNLARPISFVKRYWFLAGAILLAAVVFFAWRGQSLAANQTNYQTKPITQGSLSASVGATGTVRSAQSATLVWQTSGRVEAVNVKIGDKVTTDQILASLTKGSVPSEVVLAEANRVTAQQNLDDLVKSNISLAQAMQKLADAKQTVEDAQDKLDFYEWTSRGRASQELLDNYQEKIKDAQRRVNLIIWVEKTFYKTIYKSTDPELRRNAEFKLQVISSEENLKNLIAQYNWFTGRPSETFMATLRADLNVAIAKQEDAQREVDRFNNGKNVDEINAAKAKLAAAQATLNKAKIIAPFNGTVTQAEPLSGDRVSNGDLAFQVDDLSSLMIDLQISEVDINSVSVGQAVIVTFDAVQEKTYNGIVTSVDLSGNKNQGAVDFLVTITLADADELVKPGMTAAVTITTKEAKDVLLVSNRAVRVVNGQRVVYVLKDGQAVPVEIRLGAVADTLSEVVGGSLKEGDLVIMNPPVPAETVQETDKPTPTPAK